MEAIKIPAIRGKIGDTIYYSANLSFQQVNDMVKRVDSELHTSNSLKEVIQRSLTDNYIKIKDYIVKREDHFFDSMVLAVYDGDPQWTEIRYELNEESFNNVGLLEFSGEEKIFPVDGQHRVEGIKAAIIEKPEIANETINVILIGHSNTPEGRERSRRIFSTLNRYVKPVRLGDIIALDEDDIVAIVTRDLLETYPLLMGNKVKVSNTKSIPQNDKQSFTSLMTLYDCHKALFLTYITLSSGHTFTQTRLKDFLRFRPDDETIDNYKSDVVSFWDEMRSCFCEIDDFINNNSESAAEELRSTVTGGNLFFRPIGLLPFIEAVARIRLAMSISYHDIIRHFANMNRVVSEEPWNHILWNPITHKMEMRNQSLVKYILIHHFDHNILTDREKTDMKTKYATIFNIDTQTADLQICNMRF